MPYLVADAKRTLRRAAHVYTNTRAKMRGPKRPALVDAAEKDLDAAALVYVAALGYRCGISKRVIRMLVDWAEIQAELAKKLREEG